MSEPRFRWISPAGQGQLLLALVLIGAGWLRFHRLASSSLWSDEGNSWALISRSFGAIAQAAAADIHPPGYYWLLKVWCMMVGSSAWGMRTLSTVAGVALVWVIYRLALSLSVTWPPYAAQRFALLAALLAAVNPLQIYYSQEARMYLLLALESAVLFWALFALSAGPTHHAAASFVLAGAAGLWTHYSFPIVLAAAALAYLIQVGRARPVAFRSLGVFIGLNLLIGLLFLPWLPTALLRVLAWPKGGVAVNAATALQRTLQTMFSGPLPALDGPWLAGAALLAAALLPLLGVVALWRSAGGVALLLWLLAPVALMLALGLYSDAFLKFLILASPAWCLAAAAAPWLLFHARWTNRSGQFLIAAGALSLAAVTLPAYYTNPTARDNYAGIARAVAALGDPAQDLVLLNAPGQLDVWRYYDPGLPILALPAQRPPDPVQTVAALTTAVANRRQIYALFWATDEADPAGIVEQWLDQQAFQGVESWQGNVRFVTYVLPRALGCLSLTPAVDFGQRLLLVAECQPTFPQRSQAGKVTLFSLRWQRRTAISQPYKLSLQLLDARQQVIAQHDSEPAGGARPTTTWAAGETIVDNHSLLIPFGTPPGDYALIVAAYDAQTGQRLTVGAGDSVQLGAVQVERPTQRVPTEIIPMQTRVDRPVGPLHLLGYDQYRKGFAHAPETALAPGDLLHITLYWQAPARLPADWPTDLQLTLRLGEQSVTAPLAGGSYPTGQWQAGEVVRGEFDLLYTGDARRPWLQVGTNEYRLRAPPT